MTPPTEHTVDLATALENALKPCATSIADFRLLEQKCNSIPPLSPGRDARINTLRSDVFATERDFAYQSQRVEDYAKKVRDIEANLVTEKANLVEEQSRLQQVATRKRDIQQSLQGLERETKDRESLESQMLAKKIELSELLKLAMQFKDGLPSNTSSATVQRTPPPPTAPVVDRFMLEPDISQTNQEAADNVASMSGNNNTLDTSIYEIPIDDEEQIYTDPGAKDDSDYVEDDAITDDGRAFEHGSSMTNLSPNPRRECRRCAERGYACDRPNKRSNTPCTRCQDDGVPCSFDRPRKQRRRGRQADEELNSRLRYLREVQMLSFPEIVKMNVFPYKSESSLRIRMRRLKDRDSKNDAQPGNEHQEPRTPEAAPTT